MLTRIANVTIDDIKRIGPMYITPLFESDKVKTAVCCNPSKVEEVVKGFEGLVILLNNYVNDFFRYLLIIW